MRWPLLALWLALTNLAGSDWPTLPDPLGLGPRLTTIDWLHQHHVSVPQGLNDDDLIKLYSQAQVPVNAPTASGDPPKQSTDDPRIINLQKQLAKATEAASNSEQELQETRAELGKAQKEIDRLSFDNKQLKDQQIALQTQIQGAKSMLQEAADQLAVKISMPRLITGTIHQVQTETTGATVVVDIPPEPTGAEVVICLAHGQMKYMIPKILESAQRSIVVQTLGETAASPGPWTITAIVLLP